MNVNACKTHFLKAFYFGLGIVIASVFFTQKPTTIEPRNHIAAEPSGYTHPVAQVAADCASQESAHQNNFFSSNDEDITQQIISETITEVAQDTALMQLDHQRSPASVLAASESLEQEIIVKQTRLAADIIDKVKQVDVEDLAEINRMLDPLFDLEIAQPDPELTSHILESLVANPYATNSERYHALIHARGAINASHLPQLEALIYQEAADNQHISWEALALASEVADRKSVVEFAERIMYSGYYPEYITEAAKKLLDHPELFEIRGVESMLALGEFLD